MKKKKLQRARTNSEKKRWQQRQTSIEVYNTKPQREGDITAGKDIYAA